MSKSRMFAVLLLTAALLTAFGIPALALQYIPGVTTGQYVEYGNFVGIGPGVEAFNDYDWLRLQVTDVSGSIVTLLSTGQFKNGTTVPGNSTVEVWDVATGTENGVPNTQGPIIASNLNAGNEIPPPNTYTINSTQTRTYLGVSRAVNILDGSVFAPDYNATLTYVYDKISGMLLESNTTTTTEAQPSPVTTTVSYSIIETNIFSVTQTPSTSPTVPEFSTWTILTLAMATVLSAAVAVRRKKKNTN